MSRIIAIANQKGGVAKTTTTGAFAAGLKKKGFKVLAVDMDPQGNLSSSIGANMYEAPTVYDLLRGDSTPEETIQKLASCDIIPANIMLAGAEQEFSQTGKEYRLKERLFSIVEDYDYIVIDTPPALGVLTVNALTFADEVIIPTKAEIFAVEGIQQLNLTIQNVRKYCNPAVRVVGILMTQYNARTNNSQDLKGLAEQLGAHIDAPIYKSTIRNSVIVAEAQARKTDIFFYKKTSSVAKDYTAFTEEYLKRGKVNDKKKIRP